MAVELTPRVAQDTGGFGFQVPVFRMNQGVSAATANPMSRAAMQPMEMISEGQFGLNPNVLAMADESARAQFFAGVDELNQFVNKAAEFGIDPSKVDMSVPESFALNQEFRKRVQALQQQARGITTGAAQIAAAERAENLAFEQQRRLDYATDREEKRLEKGFLREISGLVPEIEGIRGEQGRQYGAAQSAAFRKQQTGLIKKLEAKRQQLMDQPDNVYKLQRLDEIIQQVAGVTTRPEDPRSSTTGPGGITSIKPGEMIPLTAPTSMDGLMNPVINERGQTIAAVPTVESVTLMPYYVDNQGKRIPVTSPSDPNASRIEGRAFVGVGFAKKPKITESEIKAELNKERSRLIKIPQSEMSIQQKTERLIQLEEQLRSEPETERSFVVLPEDRAQQLLQAKGSTIAPTKRQAQKMGAVESLIKSSGVKK